MYTCNNCDVDVSGLSDWEIARLLMFRLEERYSANGVSLGRSLRAELLEIIIFNTDKPEGEPLVDTLINEIEKRRFQPRLEQLMLNLGLHGLPNHYIFYFALRAIRHWYQTEAFDDFGRILTSEEKIVDTLCSIMRVDYHLRQFDEKGISFTVEEIRKIGQDIQRRRRSVDEWKTPYGCL